MHPTMHKQCEMLLNKKNIAVIIPREKIQYAF